jgi:cell division protein FtsQ
MMRRTTPSPRQRNQRLSTSRQRRHQHLLDVKVRSRKATQQRNRKLVAWLSSAFVAATAIGGIIYGGREGLRRFVWENPDYQVSEVRFETDGALTREEAVRAAGIAPGANIFTVNLASARQGLLTLPQIETAEVTRTLPNRLAITLSERKPVAWLAAPGVEDPSTSPASFLVDRRGVLIEGRHHRPEHLHLPIIYGVPIESAEPGELIDAPEARAALDLIRLNAENSMHFQVRTIDLSLGYCMVVTDRNRARITFGLDRLDWQLDRLSTLLEHVERNHQELQTVNLMVLRNVPVTFAPIAAPPLAEAVDTAEGTSIPPKTAPVIKRAEAVTKPGSAAEAPEPTVRKAEPVNPSINRTAPAKKPPVRPAPAQKKKSKARERHG